MLRYIRVASAAVAILAALAPQAGHAQGWVPLNPFNNLSEVQSPASARTNLAVPGTATANTFTGLQTFSGHIAGGGTAPAVSSCGTGTPAVDAGASDTSGTVTMGTGSPTACTVTFHTTYTTVPHCVVSVESASVTGGLTAVSATAFTITISTGTSGAAFDYICVK